MIELTRLWAIKWKGDRFVAIAMNDNGYVWAAGISKRLDYFPMTDIDIHGYISEGNDPDGRNANIGSWIINGTL